MKRTQSGFTLIELMIVVAIIGILAAVALPSYRDYAAKAMVTEALSVAAEPRTNMVMAAGQGKLDSGTDNEALGLPDPGDITSEYVASLEAKGTAPGEGLIIVTMKGTGHPGVDGKTVTLSVNCVNYACTTVLGGTVDPKFLPKRP